MKCTIQKQTNLQIWFLSIYIYILDVHYIKQMHIKKLHYELHTNTHTKYIYLHLVDFYGKRR